MPFEQSPRVATALLNVVIAMALILAVLVGYRAGHHENRSTRINDCALVLTRESGPECR